MSDLIKCKTEHCQCVRDALLRYFTFAPLRWLPAFFTVELRGDHLRIEAWHDAGASVITIPLSALSEELRSALKKCVHYEATREVLERILAEK